MKKNNKGITMIALIVTITVLAILVGVSITSLTGNEKGIIKESREKVEQAQRESILQKIQADLYEEKVKKGRALTKEEAESIIGNYGSINGEILKTTEGSYEIRLDEIIGWRIIIR